jgi:hypothetical protein
MLIRACSAIRALCPQTCCLGYFVTLPTELQVTLKASGRDSHCTSRLCTKHITMLLRYMSNVKMIQMLG